ncbi:MAG: nucleotide exchange factor GrpE [Omnitrophica WOR_2 bacterium]
MKQRKKHEEVELENVSGQMETKDESVSREQNELDELSEKEAEAVKEGKTVDLLSELQQKYNDVNDKYLRLYSDFDNFRKRAIKERIELSKTASEEVLIDFLGILDDFERAIASFEKVEVVEPIKEGNILIYNKFKNKLNQNGITEINAMGQPFNTDYHEAIAKVPVNSEELKNKVIDVTQKGYMLNGKVIRFAKVVVGQ